MEHIKDNEHTPLVKLSRTLRAPMEWIWKAWSDEEIIKKWWGPVGYISKNAESDFRIGGKYLFDLTAPDGNIIWSTGVYEEIIPHQKIVYSDHFADKDRKILCGNQIGLRGNWPKKLYVTVEFLKIEDNQIKMVVTHEGVPKEMHDEYMDGWNESLDKFQAIVEHFGDEHLQSLRYDLLI